VTVVLRHAAEASCVCGRPKQEFATLEALDNGKPCHRSFVAGRFDLPYDLRETSCAGLGLLSILGAPPRSTDVQKPRAPA
jgi:hypothetical protein